MLAMRFSTWGTPTLIQAAMALGTTQPSTTRPPVRSMWARPSETRTAAPPITRNAAISSRMRGRLPVRTMAQAARPPAASSVIAA
ncbi:MAG TPA: hypothetical protein VNR36_09395 [Pseudolysinimonas sp.]|nr:hypothetical protein [Pseudolysinimonas sp.]